MKRDLDLLRSILLAVEADDSGELYPEEIDIDGYDLRTISYHIRLLADADFIDARFFPAGDNESSCVIRRITMSGYDYLDHVRSPNIWRQIKSRLSDTLGTASDVSLDIVKAVGGQVILNLLNIPPQS